MNDVVFYRRIDAIDLYIICDAATYSFCSSTFDVLFSTFSKYIGVPNTAIKQDRNKRYIFNITSSATNINTQLTEHVFVYNKTDINSIYNLICCLEEWYSQILNCTILHCSSVSYNNQNIILLGERKSGKTTLTNFLVHEKAFSYLDDDSIYILNQKYYGFNMPISLRESSELIGIESIVCDTIDDDMTRRFLIKPRSTISEFDNIDVILFPQYRESNANICAELSKPQLFKKIMNHVRGDRNLRTTYYDLLHLISQAKSYDLQYSNSISAWDMILKLLKGSS